MDTHTKTITPSAHLSTVQELLAKLDEMKTGRIGPRQRLEFLLEKGPEVVLGFDYNDAFDLSRQVHTERARKLSDLRTTLDIVSARWHESPLDDDMRDAGDRLIGHLSEFVRQATDKESRFEVETLASLWEDAPDVFPAFGLPSPSYYPKPRASVVRGARSEEIEELNLAHERLAEEIVKKNLEETELPSEEDQATELKKRWPEPQEGIDRQYKEAASQPLAPPLVDDLEKKALQIHEEYVEKAKKKYDVVVAPSKEGTIDDGQHVVGHLRDVRRSISSEEEVCPEPREALEEEIDMLDIRSWTTAINETLASNWKFDRQLRGRVGDRGRMGATLIWTKDDSELRLDVERLTGDEVLVRLTPPRSNSRWSPRDEMSQMYRTYAKEMKEDELAELHKDPSRFVKLVLV